MKALIEKTVYKDFVAPDHVYYVEGNKLYAYKVNNKPIHVCSTPLQFSRSGRKFDEVINDFVLEDPSANVIKVKGNSGNTYEVDADDKSCSCPGFQFRGKCKHLLQVLETA
jgi:hypothetical protein